MTDRTLSDERQAFEQFAASLDLDLTCVMIDGKDVYSDCNTDYAWIAWQARALLAQAAEPVQPAAQPSTEPVALPSHATTGFSRAEWHDKAWALLHAKTFDDTQLAKVNIHTIRAVFNATYDALCDSQLSAQDNESLLIDALVNRFLGWPLPKTFAPDAGISFKPSSHPYGWPTGTNLFTAVEARLMFEYCLANQVRKTDEEFLTYCETHCTERAMFSAQELDRLLIIAGNPKGFDHLVINDGWLTAAGDIERLCVLAKERLHGPETPDVRQPSAQDSKDAARYRWLRKQYWNDADMCVVRFPKQSVKLGFDCPSDERLDEFIDAAMSAQDSQHQIRENIHER